MEISFLSFFTVKLKQIHIDKGITTILISCSVKGTISHNQLLIYAWDLRLVHVVIST